MWYSQTGWFNASNLSTANCNMQTSTDTQSLPTNNIHIFSGYNIFMLLNTVPSHWHSTVFHSDEQTLSFIKVTNDTSMWLQVVNGQQPTNILSCFPHWWLSPLLVSITFPCEWPDIPLIFSQMNLFFNLFIFLVNITFSLIYTHKNKFTALNSD